MFGVDYTPNGTYSTYDDGVMTAYKMTLTFKELEAVYNDDYEKVHQQSLDYQWK